MNITGHPEVKNRMPALSVQYEIEYLSFASLINRPSMYNEGLKTDHIFPPSKLFDRQVLRTNKSSVNYFFALLKEIDLQILDD